jgi:hypothetical protein
MPEANSRRDRHLQLLRALARAQTEYESGLRSLAALDPQTARRRLVAHHGTDRLPVADEDLLRRYHRAKTDPTFSNVERARLKRDLVSHPVLGGPSIVGLPDLRLTGNR